MRAARRPIAGVPVLALVDAFVGGTAILLIMIILSARPDTTDGMQPKADLTLSCRNEVLTPSSPLPDWMAPPPPEMTVQEALDWAASVPPPDSLLLPMRIVTDPHDLFCILYVNDALMRWRNDAPPDQETAPSPRAILAPVFVLAVVEAPGDGQ